MFIERKGINTRFLRVAQHILIWIISFYAFLHIFKIGNKPGHIDYIYTGLFHIFIVPPVYLNLSILLPWLRLTKFWISYTAVIGILVLFFTWFNIKFFSEWSNLILPDYFFITYFSFVQIAIIVAVYIIITSLLKLSKSWFTVIELQRELLTAEKQKSSDEKKLLELEAKALRAQMNPHFIFNCMNSIKSLIQEGESVKGVSYLTTFSKLIRTLFNNADKKEICLYDEIETCRLYLELEKMRFGSIFSYTINVKQNLDLKSIYIPALLIQPFIENAIWHGIMPKTNGGAVSLDVIRAEEAVEIIIEDDGIGRQASALNKGSSNLGHQSKGVNLTQSRLELDNLLRQRKAMIKTIDKLDAMGNATGTKVILLLPWEE